MMTSIYAWAVMALSLPLMVFASRFEFKRLLLAVIGLFTAGQFACAVALTFAMLVTARLLVACAHAIFWSIASVMATRAVAPEHGSLALSMVATGTSVAMVFGLPLGRAIGLAVGWRMTFACVGVGGRGARDLHGRHLPAHTRRRALRPAPAARALPQPGARGGLCEHLARGDGLLHRV